MPRNRSSGTKGEVKRAHKRLDSLFLPPGANGPQGSAGPPGPAGSPGPQGVQGLPNITSLTSAPGRALNATFQPHATRPTLCTYTVRITCTVSLGGSQTGTVELRSDAASPPVTVRDRAELTHGLGLGVGVNSTVAAGSVISHLVPAGHNVRLVSSGAAAIVLVDQTEVVM